MKLLHSLALSSLCVVTLNALSVPKQDSPSVQVGSATYIGKLNSKVESFKSIPFAQPPIGDLRLREPQPIQTKPTGTFQATEEPSACISLNSSPNQFVDDLQKYVEKLNGTQAAQQVLDLTGHGDPKSTKTAKSSEDCLYLNVYRPEGTKASDKLPVVLWIYGGAYQSGSTTSEDPTKFVAQSSKLNQDVVYVTANYRLAAFGFLNGKPVKENGVANIGLLDQRMAMQWIQDEIEAFGGDPNKVTLWGQSAGSFAIGMHLVSEGSQETNLYDKVIMESGSPYRVGKTEDSNVAYDIMAKASNCSSENSKESFECLKGLSTEKFVDAMNQVPALLSYEGCTRLFTPSVDGSGGYLPDYPDQLVKNGNYKRNVSILNGDMDDEGTLHTIVVVSNTTSNDDFKNWVQDILLVGLSDQDFETVATLYPQDPTQGSPFNTSLLNTVTPENKRIAAIYGDVTFQAPRTSFLSTVSSTNPTWTYLNKNLKLTPYLGSFHAADLFNLYGQLPGSLTEELQARWINFINTGSPDLTSKISTLLGLGSRLTVPSWPSYDSDSKKLLIFKAFQTELGDDNFRKEGRSFLTELAEVRGIRQIS